MNYTSHSISKTQNQTGAYENKTNRETKNLHYTDAHTNKCAAIYTRFIQRLLPSAYFSVKNQLAQNPLLGC